MTCYVRPGRWRLARDLQGGACACPVRAESTASGAGHGPVYRVPRLASLQPGARLTAPLIFGTVRLRSHLASPLRPGRGVLIRSVSRRLGSVAYVREDASPNEVSSSTTVEDARSGSYMSIRQAPARPGTATVQPPVPSWIALTMSSSTEITR